MKEGRNWYGGLWIGGCTFNLDRTRLRRSWRRWRRRMRRRRRQDSGRNDSITRFDAHRCGEDFNHIFSFLLYFFSTQFNFFSFHSNFFFLLLHLWMFYPKKRRSRRGGGRGGGGGVIGMRGGVCVADEPWNKLYITKWAERRADCCKPDFNDSSASQWRSITLKQLNR